MEQSIEAVKDAGATVIVSPLTVGEMGKMAFILDGVGAVLGLWEYGAGF